MLQGVIKIIINNNIYIIPYLNVGVLTHCVALQAVLGGLYSVVQTKPWWPGDEQPDHKDVNIWSLQELMIG